MRWRLVTAVVAAAGAISVAGLAIAQGPWTTVSKADLAICAPIYSEAHRIELDYIRKEASSSCTLTSDSYSADTCKEMRDWLAQSAAADPLDWYYEGNEHCEGSDYPCFGPGLYNDPRTGADAATWTANFVEDARQQARITPDMNFSAAARVADSCTAQVWVKKHFPAGGIPVAAPPPPAAPLVQAPPAGTDVTACIKAKAPDAEQLAKCDGVLTALKPADPDYGALAIALMQQSIAGGKQADGLRYGDMLAATKSGADVSVTQCVVRVLVKWDLATGLEACNAAGPANATALEARGQIHLLAGKWRDAWNDFDAAHKLNGAGQSLYLRGIAAAAQGRMGDALKDMADGEAKAPGSSQAYDQDGYSLAAVTPGKPLAPPEAFAASAPVVVAPPPAAAPAPVPTPISAPAVPAPPPPPVMRQFDSGAPRGVPASLSASEIQACEDDVSGLEANSKAWQGTPDETALRLGLLQRTIYASRCAGHPQATNLRASAERIIADAGPRAALATTTAEQTTPVVTDCLTPVPLGDASNPTGSSVFRNTCAFPVMVAYCNVAPAPGSWAEMFACETRASLALVKVQANSLAPVVFGRQINHLACKAPALPLATYAQATGLEGFCK
jgi:hypothetical protein